MSNSNTENTYDNVCEAAKDQAEERLINHFKQHGGEVWAINSGCQQCKAKTADKKMLSCGKCRTALFCTKECQVKAWKNHKMECSVISSLLYMPQTESSSQSVVESCIQHGSNGSDPNDSLQSIAKSLPINIDDGYPDWFCLKDFRNVAINNSSPVFKSFLQLYSLIKDDESWERDCESFPRSSYTFCKELSKVSPYRTNVLKNILVKKFHLYLFSIWMQEPQAPAVQTIPLESRGFFGLIDSILQIKELRTSIDSFMDSCTKK